MRLYTIDCNGHEIRMTDVYHCAYMIGYRYVVIWNCKECIYASNKTRNGYD